MSEEKEPDPSEDGGRETGDPGDNHGGDEDGESSGVAQREHSAPSGGRAVRDLFTTQEIFRRVLATADEEIARSSRQLFFSGLAAGLSMSLSFLAAAALAAGVGGENRLLVGNLLYPFGFLIVVLGRYQLFTENTLTPVTLVLTRYASLPSLLRLWGVVFFANLVGAAAAAIVLAETGVFSEEAAAVGVEMGLKLLSFDLGTMFFKGVIAGWLVATIVWLTHAVREAAGRVLIVWVVVYTIAAGHLAHCIVGACEVLYAVFTGHATIQAFATSFLLPATLGNVVGGVLVVALLNYAQTAEDLFPEREKRHGQLSWRHWMLGGGERNG